MTASPAPPTFQGSFVALVTPMNADGGVDHGRLRALVEWHAAEGTDGIVPCGTTGESATLTHDEHEAVIATVVSAAAGAKTPAGRVKVLAGTGSNATHEAVRLTKSAQEAGADGALVITPYYNKPTQEGCLRHFDAVAKATNIPLVLYNVPGRTALNLLAPTVARIAREVPRVVGIKEATADMRQVSEIVRAAPPGFAVLSGDDFTTHPLMACGGVGTISVTGNLVPRLVKDQVARALAGDWEGSRRIHETLLPLGAACFLETNPIPVKAGVEILGRCGPEIRLPLLAAQEKTREALREALLPLGARAGAAAR